MPSHASPYLESKRTIKWSLVRASPAPERVGLGKKTSFVIFLVILCLSRCDHILYPLYKETRIMEFPLITIERSILKVLRYFSGVVPFLIIPTVVSLDGTFISLYSAALTSLHRRTRNPKSAARTASDTAVPFSDHLTLCIWLNVAQPLSDRNRYRSQHSRLPPST